MIVPKIADNLRLDGQVERYLAEPIPLKEIRGYEIQRAAGGVMVLVVEILVDPVRWEAEPDKEITTIDSPERTFVRPDGTTYTKER